MSRHDDRRQQLSTPSIATDTAKHRRHSDMLCGINAVREALKAGTRRLTAIWVAERKDAQRISELLTLARDRGVRVEIKAEAHLTAMVGTPNHQGVIAFATPTAPLTLEDLLDTLTSRIPIPPIAVLDGIQDPRNLGALIRSAAAFGIGGALLRARRAVGLTATVAKAAAGGLEHVAVAEVRNISQSLDRLKKHGFWVVGADEDGDVACDTFTFPAPLALVFGEEGKGVSPLVKRHCDVLVRIPVVGPLHSLNVAVAAGVLFYAVTCQSGR
jgi:23S rRNA (guanosine2251-2'-O)-methyltransferase